MSNRQAMAYCFFRELARPVPIIDVQLAYVQHLIACLHKGVQRTA